MRRDDALRRPSAGRRRSVHPVLRRRAAAHGGRSRHRHAGRGRCRSAPADAGAARRPPRARPPGDGAARAAPSGARPGRAGGGVLRRAVGAARRRARQVAGMDVWFTNLRIAGGDSGASAGGGPISRLPEAATPTTSAAVHGRSSTKAIRAGTRRPDRPGDPRGRLQRRVPHRAARRRGALGVVARPLPSTTRGRDAVGHDRRRPRHHRAQARRGAAARRGGSLPPARRVHPAGVLDDRRARRAALRQPGVRDDLRPLVREPDRQPRRVDGRRAPGRSRARRAGRLRPVAARRATTRSIASSAPTARCAGSAIAPSTCTTRPASCIAWSARPPTSPSSVSSRSSCSRRRRWRSSAASPAASRTTSTTCSR